MTATVSDDRTILGPNNQEFGPGAELSGRRAKCDGSCGLDSCAIRAGGSCRMAHSEARCWSWRIEFVSAIDEFSNRPRSEW
jgi:hypothetical protein